MNNLTGFAKGVIAGFVVSAVIFSAIFAFRFLDKRDRELIEYAEKQIEIEALREDYVNRDPVEFMELPGVRGGADNAINDFERK